MTRPLVVVAGLGRCGTSLMMQMLAAGGISCVGTYPDFEDPRTGSTGAFDPQWFAQLASAGGQAVKVLDPHRAPLDIGALPILYLWLDRNQREQAKSQVKFLTTLFSVAASARNSRRLMQASLEKDRPTALVAVGSGRRCGMSFHFEELLGDPSGQAHRLADFLFDFDYRLDADAAARQVRPRSSACYPGMLELELLEESRR